MKKNECARCKATCPTEPPRFPYQKPLCRTCAEVLAADELAYDADHAKETDDTRAVA